MPPVSGHCVVYRGNSPFLERLVERMTTSSVIDGRIDVRRAADRFHTALPWPESHHSFGVGRLTATGAPTLVADGTARAEVLTWELGG